MSNSINRNIYFEKYIRNAPNAEKYMTALFLSPYRTHKRMAYALGPEFERLLKEKELNESNSSGKSDDKEL